MIWPAPAPKPEADPPKPAVDPELGPRQRIRALFWRWLAARRGETAARQEPTDPEFSVGAQRIITGCPRCLRTGQTLLMAGHVPGCPVAPGRGQEEP